MSPSNQTIPEGKPANISCKATGFPKPALRWTFNEDRDLPQGSVVEYNESRSFLKLKNVSKLMAGTYKCTAKNKANSTTATATLRVLGMPWFYTDYIQQLFFEIEVNSGQIFTEPRKRRGKYSQSHYSQRLKRIIVLVYTHEVISTKSERKPFKSTI